MKEARAKRNSKRKKEKEKEKEKEGMNRKMNKNCEEQVNRLFWLTPELELAKV
jgi:hypothetical protein